MFHVKRVQLDAIYHVHKGPQGLNSQNIKYKNIFESDPFLKVSNLVKLFILGFFNMTL